MFSQGKKKPQQPVSLVLCNLQLAVLQSSTRVICSLTLCLPYFSFQTVFSPLLLIPPQKKKCVNELQSCWPTVSLTVSAAPLSHTWAKLINTAQSSTRGDKHAREWHQYSQLIPRSRVAPRRRSVFGVWTTHWRRGGGALNEKDYFN